MTRKADRGELLALKVMHEQRWAFERVMEHLSYRDIRRLAAEPPERGGLGYDLSEHTLKGLVAGYRERMRGVEEHSLDEHRERELADLDAQHRAWLRLTDPIDRNASAKVARSLGYDSVEALAEADPGLVVLRDDKTIAQALIGMRAVGESRRKLLGLDAPQQIKADVTVRDAVTEELNDMLKRAGRKPVKIEGN